MPDAIEIIFKGRRLDYFVNPERIPVSSGDHVIVEAERGIDMGRVTHLAAPARKPEKNGRFRSILRRADDQDFRNQSRIRAEEVEAIKICQERISEFKLEMKLLDAESQVDGNRITFFFTAEQRVDFRELVKDLAGIFKTRIELRQVGARDAAKRIGGIGPCGREYCCSTWLKTFSPVTLKMAKNQGMSLSPSKISGGCGRLMCCLMYEDAFYKEMGQVFPKIGTHFILNDVPVTVCQNDLFREVVVAQDEEGNKHEWEIPDFPLPREEWAGAVVGKGAPPRVTSDKPCQIPSKSTRDLRAAAVGAMDEEELPPQELLRSLALTRRMEDGAFEGEESGDTVADDEADLGDAELVASADPETGKRSAKPTAKTGDRSTGQRSRRRPGRPTAKRSDRRASKRSSSAKPSGGPKASESKKRGAPAKPAKARPDTTARKTDGKGTSKPSSRRTSKSPQQTASTDSKRGAASSAERRTEKPERPKRRRGRRRRSGGNASGAKPSK